MSEFTDAFEEHFITYQRWQFPAGANVDYVWVPGVPFATELQAMPPQPAGENELRKLPDGEQVDSAIIVYSPTPANTREGDSDADILELDGKFYEVRAVDERDRLGSHYKILAVLNNDPPLEIAP